MRENTQNYISWQHSAYDLQIGSDFLTEQVRCFVETGEKQYMYAYFKESNETKRRDKALEVLNDFLKDTPTYNALSAAMEESIKLMDIEYYSMHLTANAYEIPYDSLPVEIQSMKLKEKDLSLSKDEQKKLSRSMVFDNAYRSSKTIISNNMDKCMSELVKEIESRQIHAGKTLNTLLVIQRLLIIALIFLTLSVLTLTLLLVISPLLKAVFFIRSNEPIPVVGSKEFQLLAKTYNIMYESNREQKEQLAYEATHDKLTGVYNRSGYDFFTRNLDLSSCALLVLDIDKYKNVNDTYGHEVGDLVLKKLSKILVSSFRSADYVCRLGGDEFAVIMTHAKPGLETMIENKIKNI